jgi:spore germination protein YaaH
MKPKKKIIVAIAAIVMNIASLLGIYVHLDNKQQQAAPAKTAAADSSANKKPETPVTTPASGLVGKLVQDIKKEQQATKAKIAARKKLLLKNDSLHPPVISVHQAHLKLFKGKGIPDIEKEWNDMHDIDTTVKAMLKGKFKRNERMQVFGWHPYWMGSAYKAYNFSLLTTIAYFSYELDPRDGRYSTVHDWGTTHLVDSANNNKCNILLTVSCFSGIHEFLSNKKAQRTLFSTLDSLLQVRGANGVNIDFEGVAGDDRKAFVQFIQSMYDAFEQKSRNYMITIAIPAVDWYNSYDLADMSNVVKQFIIMGYDYYGSQSETAGPVAPLRSGDTWWQYNLDRTVKGYEKQVDPSKLLLGLPYYGAEWETETEGKPSPKKKFMGRKLFKDIKKALSKLQHISIDTTSVTAYHSASANGSYTQIWFDNAATLDHKINWARNNKLGGIGIWALGYDNGTTDLWEVLKKNCTADGRGSSSDSGAIVIKNAPKSFITPQDTIDPFRGDSLAVKGYALVMDDGKYYVIDDLKLLALGIAGSFFIVLLLQIILDASPWKDKYLKRLVMYAVSAAAIVALLAALALGWLTHSINTYVMLFAGLLAGYVLSRLAGKIVKKNNEQVP